MGAGRGAAEWWRGLPVERTELRAQALICRPAAPDLAGAPCAQDTAASASLLIVPTGSFPAQGPCTCTHASARAASCVARSERVRSAMPPDVTIVVLTYWARWHPPGTSGMSAQCRCCLWSVHLRDGGRVRFHTRARQLVALTPSHWPNVHERAVPTHGRGFDAISIDS